MTTKFWNAIMLVLIACIIAGSAYINFAKAWHPPQLVGSLVEGSQVPLDNFCLSKKDDPTSPHPSYHKVMKSLQEKNKYEYERLMADRSIKCISLTAWGYQKIMGTAIDKFETFKGGDFECIVVWRFRISVSAGQDEIVFGWAACPETHKS